VRKIQVRHGSQRGLRKNPRSSTVREGHEFIRPIKSEIEAALQRLRWASSIRAKFSPQPLGSCRPAESQTSLERMFPEMFLEELPAVLCVAKSLRTSGPRGRKCARQIAGGKALLQV
jgi:hypothetical protein